MAFLPRKTVSPLSRLFCGIILVGLLFLANAERGQSVTVVSAALSLIVKKADVICVGELIDSSTSFHSYEYGKGSKAWQEVSLNFSVKELLKGNGAGNPASGTCYLPSFAEYNEPGRQEQECPVMDGSGIEAALQNSERYLFFLETGNGMNTIIRVETVDKKDEVLKLLSAPEGK